MTEETENAASTPPPIELAEPVTIRLGSSETTIATLELEPLTAGHLWPMPAAGLATRDAIKLALSMAGYAREKAEKIGKGLGPIDLSKVLSIVNAEVLRFSTAAESVGALDTTQAAKITLQDPIKKGSEELLELTLQPIRGADIWDLPAEDLTFGDIMAIGCSQAAEADVVIKRLSAWDAGQLVAVVNAFLEDFREIGKAP